jgi:hypothetical protein
MVNVHAHRKLHHASDSGTKQSDSDPDVTTATRLPNKPSYASRRIRTRTVFRTQPHLFGELILSQSAPLPHDLDTLLHRSLDIHGATLSEQGYGATAT